MLKKLSTLFLTLCLVSTAATNDSLKAALDDLNYTLSVELSKKDQEGRNKALSEFNKKVLAVKASEGLTDADVVDFMASEIKDEAAAQEIKTAYSMISLQNMSPEQTSKFLSETATKTMSEGAAWSSEAGLILGALLIVALLAAAAGGSPRSGSGCYEEYVCYDYYDSYGYLYTDCGYETYCY